MIATHSTELLSCKFLNISDCHDSVTQPAQQPAALLRVTRPLKKHHSSKTHRTPQLQLPPSGV
jgi:hypothetical protein